MFPVGLAALDQGYYGAAPAYWKAKELEDTNQAYDILGQTFMQMSGMGQQQQPTGWGGQLGPQQIPGAQMMPPGGMPPGGVPAAPGMMPRPGMPPTTPQGTLGAIIPSPAAGPAAIPGPQPGAMPPPQQPTPGPTGPPPTPLRGPGLAAPGGPGGQPQPPPQITQQLGQAPYDWRSVAQTVARANPNASPAVIARAITMMMPFLNQESQQYMRMLNLQLQEQRLIDLERHRGVTEDQGYQRLDLTKRGQDIREERYQTLSEQATRRLDQADQRLLETQRANMEREAQRAKTLAGSTDAKAAQEARQRWQAATNNYHRTMREKIGAAGLSAGPQRKQMMEDLDRQQKQDQGDIDTFYQQMKERQGKAPYKPPAESPGNVTPAPSGGQMQSAKDKLKADLQSPATRQQLDQQSKEFPLQSGGKPIPKTQVSQIQQDLAKMGPEQKQRYLQSLQEQGFDTSGF